MSSRIEQKAQAREARLAAERAIARQAAVKRRLAMLAGAILVAVLTVGVAVVASQSGTAKKVSQAERVALFEGIPQQGEWLGRSDAPIVVEEYADLQCPFCGEFATRALPGLVQRYVRSGDVRMRMRLLTFLGPDSVEAGRVAAAAGLQNRLWEFTESFYARQGQENSGYVTREFLRQVGAGATGLNLDRALADQREPAVRTQLRKAHHAAQAAGVEGTPTFRVGRRGGEMRTVGPDQLVAAIDEALAK